MYIFGNWNDVDDMPSQINDITFMGEELRSKFTQTSIYDIIEVLDLLAKEWNKESEFYKSALSSLIKELSFSKDMIISSLDIIPEILSKRSIWQRLRLELNESLELDKPFNTKGGSRIQYIPLGKILHITAGNVFLGFLDSLVMGFLTKNISFVKLSSNNQSFPRLFVESLIKVRS